MKYEKVSLVAHQLQEATGSWWHDYRARLQPNACLTWQEFKTAFHGFFIPAGAMALTAIEFCNLVQGRMTVIEYTHKFNDLAQYPPNDVPTDEVKCVKYEHGLTIVMQEKLCNVLTANFNELVSAAIKVETKKNAMENENHKRVAFGKGQGSSSKHKTMQALARILGFTAPRPMWV